MAFDITELAGSLKAVLPPELQSYALVVAALLAGLRTGEVSEADLRTHVGEDQQLASSLQCLTGQSVELSNAVLSFDNANTGDIRIQSAAGRDVIGISINYYSERTERLLPAPASVDEEALKTTFSQATRAHLTGNLWEARRLYGKTLSLDPFYPHAAERLALVERQLVPILFLGEGGMGKTLLLRDAHERYIRAAIKSSAVLLERATDHLLIDLRWNDTSYVYGLKRISRLFARLDVKYDTVDMGSFAARPNLERQTNKGSTKPKAKKRRRKP
jgi:hypothetical protein